MSSDKGQHSVLIVDDEPHLVDTLVRMLRGAYKTFAVSSTPEAIETFERELPDAVIVPLVIMALAVALHWSPFGLTAPRLMGVTLAALSISF